MRCSWVTAVIQSTGVRAQVLATSFKVPSWEIQHFGPVGQLILLYNAYILSLNLKVLKEDTSRGPPDLEIPDAPYCSKSELSSSKRLEVIPL